MTQEDFEQFLLMAIQNTGEYFDMDEATVTLSDIFDYLNNKYVEDKQL